MLEKTSATKNPTNMAKILKELEHDQHEYAHSKME